MYDQGFPWIKFTILTILFVIPVVIWSPGMKWKLLFAVCVPIGVGLALSGKSLRNGGKR